MAVNGHVRFLGLSWFYWHSECYYFQVTTPPELEQSQVTLFKNKIKEIEKWLQHVHRMDTNRLPKQAQQYRPKDEGT
jgi:hypothetical protein